MNRRKIFIIFLLAALVLSFCEVAATKISKAGETLGLAHREPEAGQTVVTHNLGEMQFRGIEAATAAKVTVRSADDPNRDVILRVSENMAEKVDLKVRNGILKIGLENNTYSFKALNGVTFEVSVPHCDGLSSLEAVAAAQIDVTSPLTAAKVEIEATAASKITAALDCSECEAEAVGASKIMLTGRCEKLETEAMGASKIDAEQCENANCKVKASGASKVRVWCTERLEAEASGASKVEYRGGCAVSESHTGASSVKRVD